MERAVRLVDEVRLLVVEISPVVQVRQRVDEGVEGEDVPGVGAVQVGFGLERQGSTGRSWKRRTPAEGTDIATMPAPPPRPSDHHARGSITAGFERITIDTGICVGVTAIR